jgi:hypothetical protein
LAIRPDAHGGWIHYFDDGQGSGYPCRDAAGVLLSTLAALDARSAPDLPDWPPLNPTYYRR